MDNELTFIEDDRAQNRTVKAKMFLQAFLSLPKTLWFNFRYFPLRTAVKLPVLIAYNLKIIEMHPGTVRFDSDISRFMIKLGFGGSDSIAEHIGSICIEKGEVIFGGKASMSKGVNIRCSGKLKIGSNFYANKNCTIWCSDNIEIGNDVLLGWNITFRDSDGHMVVADNLPRPISGHIKVGNHTWICSECHLLKNSGLGNDCVLGYGSLLTKTFEDNNVLIVGCPATVVRKNTNWIRGK